MFNLKQRYGEWAMITGGSSGIGAALARILAAQGMHLVLVARRSDALIAFAGELTRKHRVQVRVLSADLATAEGSRQVLSAVEDIEVGLLVPCAAVEERGYFVECSNYQLESMLQLNVASPMMLVRRLGAKMASRGRGAILLVSSLSGWMPQPYMAQYGACKAYIAALGAALHVEMKDKGVDVSVLSPGPTDTPMAAGTGIDFAKMGMTKMTPHQVAMSGLSALGRRMDAIPGGKNRLMAWMMSRLMSRARAAALFKRMLQRATSGRLSR